MRSVGCKWNPTNLPPAFGASNATDGRADRVSVLTSGPGSLFSGRLSADFFFLRRILLILLFSFWNVLGAGLLSN